MGSLSGKVRGNSRIMSILIIGIVIPTSHGQFLPCLQKGRNLGAVVHSDETPCGAGGGGVVVGGGMSPMATYKEMMMLAAHVSVIPLLPEVKDRGSDRWLKEWVEIKKEEDTGGDIGDPPQATTEESVAGIAPHRTTPVESSTVDGFLRVQEYDEFGYYYHNRGYEFGIENPTRRSWVPPPESLAERATDLSHLPPLILDTLVGNGTKHLAYTVREYHEAGESVTSKVFGVIRILKPHLRGDYDQQLAAERGTMILKKLAQPPKVEGVISILAEASVKISINPPQNTQTYEVSVPVLELSGSSVDKVVRFVDGSTAGNEIRFGHPAWTAEAVLLYWYDMIQNLEELFKRKIVHSDISYQNSVLAGKDRIFKILDLDTAFFTSDVPEKPQHEWTGALRFMPLKWAMKYLLYPGYTSWPYPREPTDDVLSLINVGLLLHTGYERTASPLIKIGDDWKASYGAHLRGQPYASIVCENINYPDFDEDLRQVCKDLLDILAPRDCVVSQVASFLGSWFPPYMLVPNKFVLLRVHAMWQSISPDLTEPSKFEAEGRTDYQELKDIVLTALMKKIGKHPTNPEERKKVALFETRCKRWNRFQKDLKMGDEFILPSCVGG